VSDDAIQIFEVSDGHLRRLDTFKQSASDFERLSKELDDRTESLIVISSPRTSINELSLDVLSQVTDFGDSDSRRFYMAPRLAKHRSKGGAHLIPWADCIALHKYLNDEDVTSALQSRLLQEPLDGVVIRRDVLLESLQNKNSGSLPDLLIKIALDSLRNENLQFLRQPLFPTAPPKEAPKEMRLFWESRLEVKPRGPGDSDPYPAEGTIEHAAILIDTARLALRSLYGLSGTFYADVAALSLAVSLCEPPNDNSTIHVRAWFEQLDHNRLSQEVVKNSVVAPYNCTQLLQAALDGDWDAAQHWAELVCDELMDPPEKMGNIATLMKSLLLGAKTRLFSGTHSIVPIHSHHADHILEHRGPSFLAILRRFLDRHPKARRLAKMVLLRRG
jgi:hypothetical protein